MRIVSYEMGIVRIPLHTPFKTALRTVERVEDVVVRLTAADGTVGFGEAPPTKAITGEDLESIQKAIRESIVPALRALPADADVRAFLTCIQESCAGNTSAKAALDIAVHDLAARKAHLPLYRYLKEEYGIHDVPARVLYTDLTISVNPAAQMQEDARIAMQRGFRSVKIKVGREGEKDLERIRAIRDVVGDDAAILVDANQGWTAQEALSVLHRAEDLDLHLSLVEQPVPAADLSGMAAVTAGTRYPVAADESCFHPEDARRIFEMGAADLVNIKLMKCGGLMEAQKIADYARSAGKHCMVGCMLESGIAVGAAAHFAAAQGDLVTVTDLDGPMLCSENPYVGGTDFDGPVITLNGTPGLGITQVLEAYLPKWERI